jgi:peptidoglycan/LPS O-acetylase OafA/YrhL
LRPAVLAAAFPLGHLVTAALQFYFQQIPFALVSAFLFYAACLSLILPVVRRFAVEKFDLVPPSSGWNRPALDTIRGFAALYVAAFHIWQWPAPFNNLAGDLFPVIKNGNKGVPIFAALSGLLIYRSLIYLTDKTSSRSIDDLRRYFIRRFLRVYPLFLATAVAATLLGQMRHSPTLVDGMVSEFLMLQVLGYPHLVVLPAWSLIVEVIFYCFLPIFMIVLRDKTWIGAAVLLVAVTYVGHTTNRAFMLTPYFCAGILAYELSRAKWLDSRLAGGAALLAGAYLIYLDLVDVRVITNVLQTAAGWLAFPLPFETQYSPDLCIGLLLFLAGVAYFPRLPPLELFPLRFLGVISYSVYLWHTIILTIDDRSLVLKGFGALERVGALPPANSIVPFLLIYPAAIIFWSAVSYLVIERPFLLSKPAPAKRESAETISSSARAPG